MYWIFEILLLGMVLVGLRSPRLVAHARPNRPQAAAPFFLPHDGDYYSLVPRIAVDNANGTHVAYHTFSNSANKVFYAYCASNCADSASWDAIVLGDPGYLGGDVQLALTPSGQPRMMWRLSPSSGPTQVQYAQCNTNCLNLASWTITTIASPEGWLPGEFGQS